MSKQITVEITQDCEDAMLLSSLKEMALCLHDRTDMEAFELVIKFYEGIE
mgnify:CR=1 FL=1|tara:strand:- start:11752 stop:11901 length:150 start_codon:yes stop_codon:yes gene_type:complete